MMAVFTFLSGFLKGGPGLSFSLLFNDSNEIETAFTTPLLDIYISSDKHLTENCGYLENLSPGDVVLAD